jgi:hypothetical protein
MLDTPLAEALRQRIERARREGLAEDHTPPELRQLRAEAKSLKKDLKRTQGELMRLKASRSWRLTAPLRAASGLMRRQRSPKG